MRPIRKALLVNTITIYNYYKNEDGDKVYIPSVIKQCVAYNKKNTFSFKDGIYGANKQYSWNVLMDRRNTYCDGKSYMDYTEWLSLTDEDKENYWTLQVDDIIIKGNVIVENLDEYEGEKFVIKEVVPYQDKDGSIHSREVICV